MAGLGGAGAGGWDGLDDDDWGLTEEQYDKLEQEAYRTIAERKASSSAASTAPITSPLPHRALSPATTASSPVRNDHPTSRISLESRFGKVRVSSALLLSRGVFFGGLLLVANWGLGSLTRKIRKICCSDGQMRSEFRGIS